MKRRATVASGAPCLANVPWSPRRDGRSIVLVGRLKMRVKSADVFLQTGRKGDEQSDGLSRRRAGQKDPKKEIRRQLLRRSLQQPWMLRSPEQGDKACNACNLPVVAKKPANENVCVSCQADRQPLPLTVLIGLKGDATGTRRTWKPPAVVRTKRPGQCAQPRGLPRRGGAVRADPGVDGASRAKDRRGAQTTQAPGGRRIFATACPY